MQAQRFHDFCVEFYSDRSVVDELSFVTLSVGVLAFGFPSGFLRSVGHQDADAVRAVSL